MHLVSGHLPNISFSSYVVARRSGHRASDGPPRLPGQNLTDFNASGPDGSASPEFGGCAGMGTHVFTRARSEPRHVGGLIKAYLGHAEQRVLNSGLGGGCSNFIGVVGVGHGDSLLVGAPLVSPERSVARRALRSAVRSVERSAVGAGGSHD